MAYDTSTIEQEAIQLAGFQHKAADSLAADTTTLVAFEQFSLLITRLVAEVDKSPNEFGPDALELNAELGETIEGQFITISTVLLTDLTVEQRYETSVTIANEGPHCDLTEWKHYQSPWRPLPRSRSGEFVGLSYSKADAQLFPAVSLSEFRNAVRKYCGKSGLRLIMGIKSPTDYPSGVSINRYFLRINGQRKDNGRPVSKLVIINNPMGC